MSTGLIIDGVFASEAIDSSGEILSIDGADISDLENGLGVLNYEHRGDDAAGASPNDIIGKVIFAKKIKSLDDCTDKRQLEYWHKVQLPMIYGIVRLFDGSGHPGAVAAAAIIRDCVQNGEEVRPGFSIEGTTLKRKGNVLEASVCRRVALTWKPCNKSAVAGLVSDPLEAKKSEHQHPMYSALSDTVVLDIDSIVPENERIHKALEAGDYNAAPSTLTGGAALQVEDRGLRNRVKAAVRDWDRKTPFKKFLKRQLPEVSDEFIDRFGDLVHDYSLKKAQRDLLYNHLVKATVEKIRTKAAKAPKSKTKPAPKAKAPVPPSELTIQGAPVPGHDLAAQAKYAANQAAAGSTGRLAAAFVQDGAVHTKKGVFQISTPDSPHPNLLAHIARTFPGQDPIAVSKAAFDKAIEDNRAPFQEAMKHWVRANKHFAAGTSSPALVSHAVAFALMSPGTPVPMQEYMYGMLMDSMHHHGLESIQTPEELAAVNHTWLQGNRSPEMPQHSHAHYEALRHDLTTKEGKMQGYNKPEQFRKYYDAYLRDHHQKVVDTIANAKGDAHAVARALTEVNGIGPKLARYMLGMMGAGNMIVPDTHLIRNLFGARPDQVGQRAGSSPDTDTIDHLKQTLLGSTASHDILEGLDKHYAANHASIAKVMQDPIIGPHLAQHPDQANFPAFWLHWNAIPDWEKNLGYEPGRHSSEGTSHTPFYDAIESELGKSEVLPEDLRLPFQTAYQHRQWEDMYGPVKAMQLFYSHLAPRLMGREEPEQADPVVKFEQFAIELRKALGAGVQIRRKEEVEAAQPPPVPETMRFGGKTIKPGKGYVPGIPKPMTILGVTPEHVIAVDPEKTASYEVQDLVKVPRSKGASIDTYPEELDAPSIVSADAHGVGEYAKRPEVRDLVHGLDFDAEKQKGTSGINQDESFWTKNAQGKMVYVKANHDESDFDVPSREALYYHLAHDFWGMGNYVTPTGVVYHPRTGQRHAVVANVEGGEHLNFKNYDHKNTLVKLGDSGELHKMAIMNVVSGNNDRHRGNYMMTPHDQGLKLIDHGYAYSPNDKHTVDTPSYLTSYHLARTGFGLPDFHPDAAAWLAKLDPKQLDEQMRKHSVPERYIKEAQRRLMAIQRVGKPGTDMASVILAPFRSGVPSLDNEPDSSDYVKLR